MTSKHRMRLAMRREIPDRVPVMCQLSQEFMIRNGGVSAFEMYYSAEHAARAFLYTREALCFDGILLNIAFEDDWRETFDGAKQTPRGDATYIELPDGRHLIQTGSRLSQLQNGKGETHPDIEDVDPEAVPLRLDYTGAMALHRQIVAQGDAGAFSVHGEIVSPFDCLCVLLGLSEAMMALITDPDKCQRLLERYVDQCFAFARAQLDLGVDAMKISSPFAGSGFISLSHYRAFVLPCERALVSRIHAYAPGIPVYTHTCGSIGDRLELMADTGIDGLECMDPPPLGNALLADAKRRVGERLFLKGNMDSVNVLLTATPKNLDEYVQGMIRDGGANGGYILSTACSVAPGVDFELLKQLVPLAEKHGRYPA